MARRQLTTIYNAALLPNRAFRDQLFGTRRLLVGQFAALGVGNQKRPGELLGDTTAENSAARR
jgi:hypothetical protein